MILMGRLVRDPGISYSQNEKQTCIARYTIAVDRRYKRDGEQNADFISCVAFGRNAEFAEKYFHKGIKIVISGRLQTGSYMKEGVKHYTTDVLVDEQEFAESKKASEGGGNQSGRQAANTPAPGEDGFMDVPDGIDEELPFA